MTLSDKIMRFRSYIAERTARGGGSASFERENAREIDTLK